MPTTFMILAHHQPELFTRLVQRLDLPRASVVAAIDRRSDETPFRAAQHHDISFLSSRINVNWGGYSQARIMMSLLEEARRLHPDSDHYVFLSGQDYPARSLREYLDMLEAHPHTTWMHVYPMKPGMQFYNLSYERYEMDWRARLASLHPRLGAGFERLVRIYDTRLPRRVPPMQLWRGSSSWCMSADAAQAVLDLLHSQQGRQLQRYLSHSLVSDEIWAATLLCNLPQRENIAGTEGYFDTPIDEVTEERKHYHHYIDWSPEREDPALLHEGDYQAIIDSGAWWVRKVDSQRSRQLLDMLDAHAGL